MSAPMDFEDVDFLRVKYGQKQAVAIVRAVNSNAGLVEALDQLLASVEVLPLVDNPGLYGDLLDDCEKASAALAQAKGAS